MSGRIMRTKAILLSLLMATFSLAGCFGEDEVVSEPVVSEEPEDVRIFVTDKTGASIEVMPIARVFLESVKIVNHQSNPPLNHDSDIPESYPDPLLQQCLFDTDLLGKPNDDFFLRRRCLCLNP